MRLRHFLALLPAAALLLTACKKTPTPLAPVPIPDAVPDVTGAVEVRVLNIGKADAMIITTAEKTILLDVGESDDGGRIANVVEALDREQIDVLIVTHFDRDHVGGFMKVAQRLPIEQIYYPNYRGTREECAAFYDELEASQLPAAAVTDKVTLTLDDLYIEISPTKTIQYVTDAEHKRDNDNDMSLLVSMWHGGNRLLFAADAEDARLREILSGGSVRAQFLKVPHHGVASGYSKSFLDAVRPVYAVICDSQKNPASDAVLAALNGMNATTMCTKDGDITLVSDGQTLTMTQGKI